MKTISSNLLNGVKWSCKGSSGEAIKNTEEIQRISAEIAGDEVTFSVSVICYDMYDWDAGNFLKTFQIGKCLSSGSFRTGADLYDESGIYFLELKLDDDLERIEISCKQNFFTWSKSTRKLSAGQYEKTPFTKVTTPFKERSEDFFEDFNCFTVKPSRSISAKQFDLLTKIHPPLETPEMSQIVKEILTNRTKGLDLYDEAHTRVNDIKMQTEIWKSLESFHLLRKRIEWLNGFYANRRLDDNRVRIDVLMPTFGWSAMGRERSIVDAMLQFEKDLGLEGVASMFRFPVSEVKEVWYRYKALYKNLTDIRPSFYTNEDMSWNP